jgi:hypothetical protein
MCYKDGMLDQLTIESFEPHVGSSFWAEFPNGAKVELRLVRAAKVMKSEAARLPRHPFSLYFIGPRSYKLEQQVYRIVHDQIGALEFFLVPVGETGDTYEYEAVFT